DAARDLRLGLYDDTGKVWQALKERGHQKEDATTAGVLSAKWGGYITFPWNDDGGHPLTIYGRWHTKTPPDKKPKTLALWNPKEDGKEWERTKRSPYLLDRALRAWSRELVLVEGIIDAAVAQAHGDMRVVACVAAELSHEQVKTLAHRSIESVTICLDPD